MQDQPVFNPFEGGAGVRGRGYLPHWERDGSTYFVTFRLVDSLPAEVAGRLSEEKRHQLAACGKDEAAKRKVISLHLKKLDEYLDAGTGSCILRLPENAKLVSGALTYFLGDRYHLYAWCVMPNHVHALIQPCGLHQLKEILHSWKSYTGHKLGGVHGFGNHVWQTEYFDHIVRSEAQLNRIMHYIATNPSVAGLADWPWVHPQANEVR